MAGAKPELPASNADKITELVERLCRVVLGAANKKQDQSVSYALRILGSRMYPSIEKDDFLISEAISRKLSRRKATVQGLSGPQAAVKFQECYSRLRVSGHQHFSDKWAVLYLLFALSGQDSTLSSSLDLARDRSFHVGIQAIPDVKASPANTTLAPTPAPKKNLANNSSETPEAMLLRDAIFALQGIDGHYIKYDASVDGFCVSSLTVPHAVRQLVRRVCEVGWMYKRVCEYVNSTLEAPVMGLVEQSFCGALQQDLTDYYRLVAVLESQVNDIANTQDVGQFSLRRMLVWVADPLERLKLMALLTDAAKGLKGGSLASAIGAHLRHGDPFVQGFVRRVLEQVCRPIFDMIQKWVSMGELHDPFGEFFVATDETKSLDTLWRDKYTLRSSMLPSFISQELGTKILMIGKSINFCRHCCQEQQWASPVNIGFQHVFETGQHGSLEAVINEAAQDTNARVMRLMLEKFKFPSHCLALRKYLLLGAGDFIQVLLDQLGCLNNPAETVFRHNLRGILETAIRSSNVQFEDTEILDRLDVQLLPASSGDTGWDVFCLDFKTNTPLNVVFTDECMKKYLRVFMFLWRLKRLEHTLNATWNRHMSMARRLDDAIVQTLRKSHIVRAEMQHFVQTLHNYVVFEVLECAWKELEDDIARAKDLEDLIRAHQSYLDQVVDKTVGSANLPQHLNSIFKIIIRLGSEQEKFYADTFRELDQQTEKKMQEGVALTKGASQAKVPKQMLEQVMILLLSSEAAFKKEVHKFFDALQELTVSQALINKLDFNEFYASRKPEKKEDA